MDTIHAINILARMDVGETVVESFKSERTARANANKFIDLLGSCTWFKFVFMDCEDEEKARQMFEFYDVADKFGGATFEEAWPLIKKLNSLSITKYKFAKDSVSVKDFAWRANMEGEDSDTAKYGPHIAIYSHRAEFGKYVAKCESQTNTSKKRTVDVYHELVKKGKEHYGLLNAHYLPSLYTIYSSQPTERMYEEKIAKIRQDLSTTPEPCSDKQAYWIQSKLGVDGSSLNKRQASELLDALFSGDEDCVETINYYKKKLGTTTKEKKEILGKIISEEIKRFVDTLLQPNEPT